MESAIITAARQKFAGADLRMARKHGQISVAQTVKGLLDLSHADGIYTLSTNGLNAHVLAAGKPATVKPVLAALYSVAGE